MSNRTYLLTIVLMTISIVACTPQAHIVVLDQDDDPVEGVLIRSNVQPGNAYFSKDETTVEYTDKQGRVALPVGRWFSLTLAKKDGYQFREAAQFKREFGHDIFGTSAQRFTKDKPLIVRAWKRGKQLELTYVEGRVFFPDTIEECTLELVQPTYRNRLSEPLVWTISLDATFKKSSNALDLNFPYKPDTWSSVFAMSQTDLQDTSDLFLNEAPKQGYQSTLKLGPFSYGNEPPGAEVEDRRLFFRGQAGQFYGGGLLFLKPFYGTKATLNEVHNYGFYFQMWFNFDGSTNIMRPVNRTVWDTYRGNMKKAYYCREAPQTWN